VFSLEDNGTVDIGTVGASSVARAQKRVEHVRSMTVTDHLGLDEDEQTLALAFDTTLDARLEHVSVVVLIQAPYLHLSRRNVDPLLASKFVPGPFLLSVIYAT
jgi:hypothetical protein